jgi:exopolysaccharide biosynthesis polyprenyl glycosylphosphotransferase
MNPRQGQFPLLFVKFADMAMLMSALAFTILAVYAPADLADARRFSGDFLRSNIETVNAVVFSATVAVWHLAIKMQGLYYSVRFSSRSEVLVKTAKASTVNAVALLVAGQAAGWDKVTFAVCLLFWPLSFALLAGFRIGAFQLARLARRHGINVKTVLVIGGGARGARIMRTIEERRELGYRILGYLDSEEAFSRRSVRGVAWLGSVEELPEIISNTVIDEVIIALPVKSQYNRIKMAVAVLEEQGILVHIVSDLFPNQLARMQSQEFEGWPLLSLHSAPPFCWRTDIKRAIDFFGAAFGLIAISPLLIVTAIVVKLESKGPVFFFQERMGYNKRRFRMIKFRTMVVDAEARMSEIEHLNEKDGAIFKIKNDPRITRIGRHLRRFSIDELPQLWNVLVGDMSLVGPRPLSIRDAMKLESGSHKRRFSVRPGLTCLWQVSGRSELSFEEWMKLDLEYIDRWSLALDGKILLQTLPAVVTAKGAV